MAEMKAIMSGSCLDEPMARNWAELMVLTLAETKVDMMAAMVSWLAASLVERVSYLAEAKVSHLVAKLDSWAALSAVTMG